MYPAADPGIDAESVSAFLCSADAPSPVAVGGSGGSGTRLVVQMLRALGVDMGNDCNPAGDAMPFVPLYDRFNNLFLSGRLGRSAFVDQLLQCFAQHHAGMPQQAPWGWKNPRSIYLLPLLDRVIPGLRYVHVVRDGLAMSSSANQAQLAKHGDTVLPPSMRDLPDSTRSLLLWAIVNSAAADYGQTMGSRYLRVRYEDMCEDPAGATRRLACALHLPLAPALAPVPVYAPRRRTTEVLPAAGTAAHALATAGLQRFGYPC